jgi:hypothetical protein
MLALMLAAAAQVAVKVGPFEVGQPLPAAREAAQFNGLELRPWRDTGRFNTFSLWDRGGTLRGTLSACDGAVQFASLDLKSYDDFTSMLRQRLEGLGQPKVALETNEITDGSGTVESLTFTWGTRRYAMWVNGKSGSGFWGNHSIGTGLKCL